MWSRSDPQVFRQYRPAAFTIERRDPFQILGVMRKFIAQRDNLMILDEKSLKAPCEPGTEVMINEQLQDESCCWNTTASRTAPRGIS